MNEFLPCLSTRGRRGFTLIELLVVIAIIAILAAILFPVFARARENARRSACQSNLKQIGLGFMQYTQDYDEKFPMYFQGQSDTPVPQTDSSALGAKYSVHDTGQERFYVSWMDAIAPYVKSQQLFVCPSMTQEQARSVYGSTTSPPVYAYSTGISGFFRTVYGGTGSGPLSLAELRRPAETVLALDYATIYSYANPADFRSLAINAPTTTLVSPHLEGTNICYTDGHVKWQSRGKTMAIASGATTCDPASSASLASSSWCDRNWNPFID